jgi:arginyl-tRNA--protein-N-Asp/Glu arginylyltransferase
MYAQVHCPQKLTPQEHDHYLELGWFRMGQTIFTTNFLNFRKQFYSAIWLRVDLKDFSADNTQRKLFKQNEDFRIEIQEAAITPEKETLFTLYKNVISFNASASLHALLYGKALHNIYHTLEINVYDDDRLIASGFFDVGSESAAGITAFYDPAYRKHSLGKYLIYLKMNYCRQRNLRYFYPGYFVPGYAFFDYKLGIGKDALQYLQLRSGQWRPITDFSVEDIPLKKMRDKLATLQALFMESEISMRLLTYEFFEANLYPDLQGENLFDSPLFLSPQIETVDAINPLIIYDERDQLYHLITCISLWPSNVPNDNPGSYSSHLLKMDRVIYSAATPEEMLAIRPLISSLV